VEPAVPAQRLESTAQAIAEFHADAGYIDGLARAIEKCESPDRW
jgi:hypothetical protein